MLITLRDLQTALQRDELVPFYQPVVDITTGQVVQCEALTRWEESPGSYVLPTNLIALAEQSGLIVELTDRIMHIASADFVSLPANLSLAVNVSPLQLEDHTLPQRLSRIAEETGFPLTRLKVEVTESALVKNIETAKVIAGELKDMGCALSLDDFGTGYSSLSYLRDLPFDELKIDRSFVSEMLHDRSSRKIVATVIGLGHSLRLSTVAEGVENEEQANVLLWLGCKLGQGWLYGKPQNITGLKDQLSRGVKVEPDARGSHSRFEALPDQRFAQLQAIYCGTPIGLCYLNKELRYVNLNLRYAELNHSTVQAHIGNTVEEMCPEVFAQTKSFLAQALDGKAFSGVEAARPSLIPSEPPFITYETYQPAYDEAGEVVGLCIAVVDHTPLYRDEALLRASAQRYLQAVDKHPNTLWKVDPSGNVQQVSSSWIQLTGLTEEQSLRLGWLEALHPDDVQPILRMIRDAFNFGRPLDGRYRIKTKAGDWRWIRARGAPNFGPTGELMGWSGSSEGLEETNSNQSP